MIIITKGKFFEKLPIIWRNLVMDFMELLRGWEIADVTFFEI